MENEILITNYTFTQNAKYLVAATTKGFRYIRLSDSKVSSKSEWIGEFEDGINIACPFYCSQVIGLVGRGGRYWPQKLLLWDDYQKKTIGDLRFRVEVKNVLMRHDHLIIILPQITYVYQLKALNVIDSLETGENEDGLGAVTHDNDKFILVSPDVAVGKVHVENYFWGTKIIGNVLESGISFLSISHAGELACAGSMDGTMLHVFDPLTLEVKHVLKRGQNPVSITSMPFSQSWQRILWVSNSTTIHMWDLTEQKQEGMLNMISSYFPSTFFQGRRSDAKFTINKTQELIDSEARVGGPKAVFTDNDTFYLANLDGSLAKYSWENAVIEQIDVNYWMENDSGFEVIVAEQERWEENE